MKRLRNSVIFLIALASLLAMSSLVLAQSRDIPRGGESSGSAVSSPAPAASVGAISSRDNSSSIGSPGYSSSMPSIRSSIPSGTGGYSGTGYSGGGGSYVPDYSQYINDRTSFYNFNSFMRSQMLFDLLRLYYGGAFNRQYFSRYYNNTEPIFNRKMLYYSLQRSASLAEQLMKAATELNSLLAETSGKAMSNSEAARDPRWNELTTKIRLLAKQIKDDEFLPYVDIRKANGGTAVKTAKLDKLSQAEQASRLVTLAAELGNQLSGMINNANPAVVSVNSLYQPTCESLAKEIERVAKNLEKATRS